MGMTDDSDKPNNKGKIIIEDDEEIREFLLEIDKYLAEKERKSKEKKSEDQESEKVEDVKVEGGEDQESDERVDEEVKSASDRGSCKVNEVEKGKSKKGSDDTGRDQKQFVVVIPEVDMSVKEVALVNLLQFIVSRMPTPIMEYVEHRYNNRSDTKLLIIANSNHVRPKSRDEDGRNIYEVEGSEDGWKDSGIKFSNPIMAHMFADVMLRFHNGVAIVYFGNHWKVLYPKRSDIIQ